MDRQQRRGATNALGLVTVVGGLAVIALGMSFWGQARSERAAREARASAAEAERLAIAGASTSLASLQPEDAGGKPERRVGVGGDRRFGVENPPRPTPGRVRLATYNIENLFDAIDDPNLSDRNEDIDDTKPYSELEAAAAAIETVGADILCLEEVESEAVVRWYRDSYLENLGYTYLASLDAGDERGIEQSVLSRYPIKAVKNWVHEPLGGVHPDQYEGRENWYAGQPLVFHRSPLMVDLEIQTNANEPPYLLTLLVVHHKSGSGSGYWREAEAKKVVEIIRQLEAEREGRNIAVLGDFNSQAWDEPLKIYRAAGMIDVLAPFDPDKEDAPQSALPKTSVTHSTGRRIDMILVNKNFEHEIVKGSGFVYGTPVRSEGSDWRTTPAPVGYASDHFPVALDIVPKDE
ncbi:MAG: endonuclease/exonuclease/phosphatase family protein [Phycisphaerales bacterium]|jgi:endonuclease/exonuclease/phosphatase family metal-dependent hydrolase|nr:endonuclease/exonuclease/phosphatase family protein [Phycisphaerales bacterium]